MAKVPLASTPEGWIEAEASFTATVRGAGAPVPRLLGVEQLDGRTVAIYERVDGRSMWDQMVLQPRAIPALARSLAALQAHLFSFVAPVSLPSQHDRLTSKIRIAARRFDRSLIDALGCVPAPTARRSLCHGDLHPGNVILGRDGPVLIDWFDVSGGEPAGDIARTALLQSSRAHGAVGPRHLVDATPQLLQLATRAYLAGVAEVVPISREELDRWTALMAVARLAEGVEPEGLLALWREWRRRHGPS